LPITGRGYQAGLSFAFAVPKAELVLRQRLEEFWTYLDLPLEKAEAAVAANRLDRNEAYDRLALAAGRNLDVLTLERTLDELGEVGLGFKDRGRGHRFILLS
jgi:hypothetical protein